MIRLVTDPEGLARFTAVPGPTGSEEPRIRWLEERLASAGGTLARDEAGNLVWRFGPSSEPPALLLMAHVDTVFAGLDAIEVVRAGDELIGPGVGTTRPLSWRSSGRLPLLTPSHRA